MEQYFSVNGTFETKRGTFCAIELEPNQKITIGDEILLDGEPCVVVGVGVFNSRSSNALQRCIEIAIKKSSPAA